MVLTHPFEYEARELSLYGEVTRWAASRTTGTLLLLSALGLGGCVFILFLERDRWPFAGILLSIGTVGLWGLIEQRAGERRSMLTTSAERVIAGIGILVAITAALAIFLSLMGPRPIN